MGDDRAVVYEDEGRVVYRASALGGCLTMLAAARQGVERKKVAGKVEEVYAAGHKAEEEFFKTNPDLAHYQQMEVVVHVVRGIEVVGRMDAWTETCVVEVKSQSEEEWGVWREHWWEENPLWKKYAWQISAYMVGIGAACAHVYRVNRANGKWRREVIDGAFYNEDQIRERVLEVEALAGEDRLVCKTPSFFCEYPGLHQALEPVEDEELEELVREYVKRDREAKAAKAVVEGIKGEIKERVGAMGRGKVLLMSGHQVSLTEYDTKDRMVKGGHVVRLTIT
jgi:hypothetical protein